MQSAPHIKGVPVGIKMETTAVRGHRAARSTLFGAQLSCLVAAASWVHSVNYWRGELCLLDTVQLQSSWRRTYDPARQNLNSVSGPLPKLFFCEKFCAFLAQGEEGLVDTCTAPDSFVRRAFIIPVPKSNSCSVLGQSNDQVLTSMQHDLV